MRSRFAAVVLSSAVSLFAMSGVTAADPIEDARYQAELAEAQWRQSRCALDEAARQLRSAEQRRVEVAAELDSTLQRIAAWPMELERVRADIRRMEADLQRAISDEQRIQSDLERMRADLDRSIQSLEYLRQSAVNDCVGIEQWRDAVAWQNRCIDRIELRRQVVRRPLMNWPTYREVFEQFTATRDELARLREARAGEDQVKPVQDRLDRLAATLRGFEDDALSRDPEAMEARAELDRAQREVDRLQVSIDKQLQRLPAVQQAQRQVEAINVSIGQAEQALKEVREQRATIEQSLRQAREAERFYSNRPWQWQSRANSLREQLERADAELCAARARFDQLASLESVLRLRSDDARGRYELALATYCPPARHSRLIVAGDVESHDAADGRPRPSDPSRRSFGERDPAPDRPARSDGRSASSRRDSDRRPAHPPETRDDRDDRPRTEVTPERSDGHRNSGGSAARVARRPAPPERG